MKAFSLALERYGSTGFRSAAIPPTPELVFAIFKRFQPNRRDRGRGARRARGPWNEGATGELVHAPAFQESEGPNWRENPWTPAETGAAGNAFIEKNTTGQPMRLQ